MTNPFDIPELRFHLATFLDIDELYKCILVCKAWHNSFIPRLYYQTSLSKNRPELKIESIKRNLVHVKSLRIPSFPSPIYYSLEFSNLVMLEISDTYPGISHTATLSFVSQILKKSKDTLTSFSLSSQPLADMKEIWDLLLCCTKITFLRLCSSSRIMLVRPSNLEKFITLLTRVTTLQLGHVDVMYCKATIPNLSTLFTQPSNLVDLECCCIADSPNQINTILLHLISKSTNLRSVRWRSNMIEYRQHAIKDCVPFKISKTLNTLHHWGRTNDNDLASILRAMTDLRELRLTRLCLQQKSYQTLIENHSNTITIVDIIRCFKVSSSVVQGILSNCPALISLSADYIRGTDLVRITPPTCEGTEGQDVIILGDDWVCHNLCNLKLFFDLSSNDANIDRSTAEGAALFQRQQKLEQYHSFRQLSRLRSLHSLDLRPKSNNDRTTLNLRLRTNGGELNQLCTLNELHIFHPYTPLQDIGREEWSWMDEFWNLDEDSSLAIIMATQ